MDYELIRQFLKVSIVAVFIILLLARVLTGRLPREGWAMLILGSMIIIGIGGVLVAMLTM